jgi:hypothetical protein
VDEQVAGALNQPIAKVFAARQRLVTAGLIGATGALTSLGHEQLRRGRESVAAMTEKLTDGIDPASLDVATEVLDAVRTRAEKELSG